MPDRSYLGIDTTDDNEWIVALLVEGKVAYLRTFKNTSTELVSLVRFISEHCARPKICLTPTSRAALKLRRFISDIPGVEVVLLSEAGLRMHRASLPQAAALPERRGLARASLLARCAQRMI